MAELDCGNVNNGANGDAIPEISKCEENASDTSLNVTDRVSCMIDFSCFCSIVL